MGVKGKLIASMKVKCGGHIIYDLYHTNTHRIPNISPNNVNHFEIHEGETIKVDSIVSWNYNDAGQKKFMKQVIEAIDPHKKSSRWKVIQGDVLELYNSFTIAASSENQWFTCTLEYEKKTEDTPEPLILLGLIIDMTKDIEGHLFKK
ncbi:hypothetical protein HAX54_038611 [Datura stramonium]|uniref:Bet v I/Major latex protein domain-containing protein n=1 Tax=Datura stramonium TaxID=4076 RepID=A0ABS8VNA3_DATST|nr:hypothetical protein [Datura stramonium]